MHNLQESAGHLVTLITGYLMEHTSPSWVPARTSSQKQQMLVTNVPCGTSGMTCTKAIRIIVPGYNVYLMQGQGQLSWLVIICLSDFLLFKNVVEMQQCLFNALDRCGSK